MLPRQVDFEGLSFAPREHGADPFPRCVGASNISENRPADGAWSLQIQIGCGPPGWRTALVDVHRRRSLPPPCCRARFPAARCFPATVVPCVAVPRYAFRVGPSSNRSPIRKIAGPPPRHAGRMATSGSPCSRAAAVSAKSERRTAAVRRMPHVRSSPSAATVNAAPQIGPLRHRFRPRRARSPIRCFPQSSETPSGAGRHEQVADNRCPKNPRGKHMNGKTRLGFEPSLLKGGRPSPGFTFAAAKCRKTRRLNGIARFSLIVYDPPPFRSQPDPNPVPTWHAPRRSRAVRIPERYNHVTQTRYGTLIYNKNDVRVGRSIELYGEYCERAIVVFDQYALRRADRHRRRANIGWQTLFFAKKVGPEGSVLAFEPQRLVFQTMCGNMAINSITNVHCWNAAVGGQARPDDCAPTHRP